MDKKIEIYSTPTCHYCQMTKEFLKEKGIEVELITIEGGGHGGPGFKEQHDKVEEFFNKNLKH